MLRKDIKDIINYHLRGYGRGFKYDCTIYRDGDAKSISGITELQQEAKEGDEIRVQILKGHQSRWDMGHVIDGVRIKITEDNIDLAERYRDTTGSSIWYNSPQDSQKQKVYDWERDSVDNFKDDRIEDLEEAQEFVEEIFEEYDLTPPNLKYQASRESTCSYFGIFHEIRIADWGFSKPVLIHESAHGFISQLGLSHYVSAHGPLFVGIYLELLDKFLEYCDKENLEMDASYLYSLDYIEDVDIEYWKSMNYSDEELDLGDLNRMRQTDYVSSDGTELTDNQKKALKSVSKNADGVDGRSANALIRRDLMKENGSGYDLTKKGEKAIQYLT